MATILDTLETGLRLEGVHARIAQRLAQFDPDLRLRRSASADRRRVGICHILERKSREPQPATVNDVDYRIAARDGFVIISPVHVSYLMREEAIVEALYEGDMARQTTGERFQKIVNGDLAAKQTRKKNRREDFRAFYAESFDVLERVGDKSSHAERTRLNNAGVEPFTVNDRRRVTAEGFALDVPATGKSPVQEAPCPSAP